MSQSTIFVCCLYFFALTTNLISAMTADQKKMIHDHVEALAIECMGDYPITETDIAEFKARKMATGENAPCFVACVMKKMGVMDDAGFLQKESVLELAKKVFNDEEEVKNIEKYLHSCSSVNSEAVSDGAKGCERAVLAHKCMLANAADFGFDV